MSKDIYELFNQKQSGIYPYESIEEGLSVLSDLDNDYTQTMVNLEVAQYLDSLILENLIYEDFDEEKLSYTIEATEENQKGSIVQTLQAQWEKLKQWFANMFQTVTNFFVNGEKLVKEHGAKIPEAIKKCNVKVRMNEYNPHSGLSAKVLSLSSKIKSLATQDGMTKERLLAQLGIDGKKGMQDVVKKLIVKTEGKEMMVSDIDPKIAMDYVGNKKEILDNINKDKKDIDAMFKEAIGIMKGKDATEKQKAMIPVFNFAISIKNGLTSAYIGFVRKACNDYLTVIRKALGGKGEEGEEKEGKFGFGKKEKKFKEKDKKFKNGVKITDAFYKAVNDKKERLLRIMVADSVLIERGEGPTTKQMWKEIKKAKIDIFGKEDISNRITDKSKWDKDYLDKLHVRFKGNGSESLYKHLVEVTSYYYKHKDDAKTEAKVESFLASIGLLDDDEE